jgi:hypothetical protein
MGGRCGFISIIVIGLPANDYGNTSKKDAPGGNAFFRTNLPCLAEARKRRWGKMR